MSVVRVSRVFLEPASSNTNSSASEVAQRLKCRFVSSIWIKKTTQG